MKPYTLTERFASVPVKEFTASCVDVEKFLGYCRQCRNCGKIWACPPFSFDPMDIWSAYDILELHALVLTPGKDMTMEELMEVFRMEKRELSLKVLAMEKEIPGSLSLAAGTCIECSPCLRTQGKPCCRPEQLRYSIEALGGDVGKLTEEYLKLPIRWISKGQLPDYLTLAAGLL